MLSGTASQRGMQVAGHMQVLLSVRIGINIAARVSLHGRT